jgi:peptidoglycan/LPS O-acetylase OafA/YrhL
MGIGASSGKNTAWEARIPSLDGIRAVAILMVVLAHLGVPPGFISLPAGSGDVLGDTGVRIFFVLSGFLISTLLIGEHTRTGKVNLAQFYIRRVFRICPAFYLYLAALAAGSTLGWIVLRSNDLAKAAVYTVDYFPWSSTSKFVRHIWSLSVEEQFYLLWPVAIWALGPSRAKWIALVSIIASPFWRLAVFQFLPVAALTIDRRFDCISDALATGCLLASLNSTLANSPRYRATLRSRWILGLPIVVLGAATLDRHPHVYFGAAHSVMNLGIALYLHHCILFPPRLLNTAVFRQIGQMSYSIYLWQQLFCTLHIDGARVSWSSAVLLTISVAAVSYYAVERPLQRLGRRLVSLPQKVPALQPELS